MKPVNGTGAREALTAERYKQIDGIVKKMLGGDMPEASHDAEVTEPKIKIHEIRDYVNELLDKGDAVKAANAIMRFAELDTNHHTYELPEEELDSLRPKAKALMEEYVTRGEQNTVSKVMQAFFKPERLRNW